MDGTPETAKTNHQTLKHDGWQTLPLKHKLNLKRTDALHALRLNTQNGLQLRAQCESPFLD